RIYVPGNFYKNPKEGTGAVPLRSCIPVGYAARALSRDIFTRNFYKNPKRAPTILYLRRGTPRAPFFRIYVPGNFCKNPKEGTGAVPLRSCAHIFLFFCSLSTIEIDSPLSMKTLRFLGFVLALQLVLLSSSPAKF